MQIVSFWLATCTHMAQESGGPLSVTLEARQIVYVNSASIVTLLEPAFEPSAMSASCIL